MKKNLLVLAAFLIVVSGGCAKKAKDNIPVNTETDSVSVIQTEAVSSDKEMTTSYVTVKTEASEVPSEEDEGLYVFSENITDNQCIVTLSYPFYGDGKHDAFDISMRNYAMQKYYQSGMFPEEGSIYEITRCEIMLETEYFVSAVVEGRIISPDATHDTVVAYTINADTGSGKIYLSEELIGDLTELRNAFIEGRFAQKSGMENIFSEISAEDIAQSWRSDYGIFPNMYFTENTFGIAPEVPHALIGTACFEIPYENTGNMINSVAKGLCGIIVTTD